jgi:hypothetical protein
MSADDCSTTSPTDPMNEPLDEHGPPAGAAEQLYHALSVAGEELLLVQRACAS